MSKFDAESMQLSQPAVVGGRLAARADTPTWDSLNAPDHPRPAREMHRLKKCLSESEESCTDAYGGGAPDVGDVGMRFDRASMSGGAVAEPHHQGSQMRVISVAGGQHRHSNEADKVVYAEEKVDLCI